MFDLVSNVRPLAAAYIDNSILTKNQSSLNLSLHVIIARAIKNVI